MIYKLKKEKVSKSEKSGTKFVLLANIIQKFI
jgi:hypothetical protein